MKLFRVDIKTKKAKFTVIDRFESSGSALLKLSKRYWDDGILSIRSRPLKIN